MTKSRIGLKKLKTARLMVLGTVPAYRKRGLEALMFIETALRARAQGVLSFGRLTLPHQIVRVLALEQLYRAATILTGHPYHRT